MIKIITALNFFFASTLLLTVPCAAQVTVKIRPAIETAPAKDSVANSKWTDPITQADLLSIVRKLADDSFEGRESGSRGGRAAGNLLVEYFSRYKLTPMGDRGSYFQSFGQNYRNLLGFIPGSDPELKNEFIMIGAHYDHVGYGTPKNSYGPTGFIHNGADDNGSGTAALIEIMQVVSELKQKPARSIIFALWDGEEKGLLGSKDWVQNRLTDPARMKLYINMDMVGRLRNSKLEVYGTRSAPGLRRIVSNNNSENLNLAYNWRMRDDSDHHSFWKRDIPAIMFHTGLHDQYHRPSDDEHTINVRGIKQVADLTARVLVSAANEASLSSFRRESWQENEATRRQFETKLQRSNSRLGVGVAEVTDGRPLQITSVMTDSPASRAGIQAGDRIVSINQTGIGTRKDVVQAIRKSPKDCSVEIVKVGTSVASRIAVQLLGKPTRIGMSWRSDAVDPDIVLVARVEAESPASLAGMKVGDRIFRINGKRYKDSDEMASWLGTLPSPIELELENTGILRTVKLSLD